MGFLRSISGVRQGRTEEFPASLAEAAQIEKGEEPV